MQKKLRLIGQYAMPILMVTALVAAPGSAIAGITNTVPFEDMFENFTNGTPLIDGTNGWYGSSIDIIVQTNVVCTNYGDISTKAAMIPVDCTLSNRFVSTNSINVWIQMDINAVFYDGQNPPTVDTNQSSTCYIASNGYFVVHNGVPFPTPTNSVNWVTLRTNTMGQAIAPISENTWVRMLLHQNYGATNWALYANNALLAENIGFINTTATNFMDSTMYNGNMTSYLDNVYVLALWAELGVSPTNISREIWQGQDAGSNLVEVWNNLGLDAMTFTNTVSYTTNCGIYTNWLTVTPATGISYGAHQAVWVRMITTNLPPQTNAYEANVRVTAEPGTTNSPQDVRVTVFVQGVGLWVSTNYFSKVVTVGQGDVFDEIKVANTGAAPRGTMSYTLTTTNTWLSVSPTNGDAQYNTNTVNLRYLTTNLSAAGWYTGRVDVVALGAGTQTVDVVLRVNHRPGVAWNAGSKVWTNEVMAGGSIGSTTVEIWNASGAPVGRMNYQLSVLNDSFGWVSGVSPASGVSTGDHQVATVSYTTTGLVAGVYTAQLKVAGVDAATGEATTNGPLIMGLQLTVNGTPALKTDVTSLSQTVLENHTGTN
ncbi:MAG: hypothetical protein KKF10_01875, partial [Verrucomicrobia bacterium]|nr:hypothetical protein [Verrucomicrobiota bacterium]